MTEPRNSSVAFMRRGTDRIPIVARRNCKTCMSRHRSKIERLVIDGVPAGRIVERLPRGENVSEQSIRRHHKRGHLPVDHKAVLRRLDARERQRWDEVGSDATDFETERALDAQDLLDEGFHRLLIDQVPIRAEDILGVARYLDQKEQLAAAHQDEVGRLVHARQIVVQDFRQLLEIVGEVLGHDARNEVFHHASIDDRTSATLAEDEFSELRADKDDWLDSKRRNEPQGLADPGSAAA